MKYRIIFRSQNSVQLPIQYKHIVQAAFLSWIQEGEYTDFLHEDGYRYGGRQYKLYCLSDILNKGKLDRAVKKLIFPGYIELIIGCYMSALDDAVIAAIENGHPFRLGNVVLYADEYEEIEEEDDACVVQTLSPITIHTTFQLPSGSKKTYYYSATEADFAKVIRDNLVRKYISIYGVEPEDTDFRISVVEKNKLKKAIISYKSTIIEGWKGTFKMEGNPELIRIALLCGLGARNGIGMGAIIQKQ